MTNDGTSLVSASIATNTHASPISAGSDSRTLRLFLPTKHQISSLCTYLALMPRIFAFIKWVTFAAAVFIRPRTVPLCSPVMREIARTLIPSSIRASAFAAVSGAV